MMMMMNFLSCKRRFLLALEARNVVLDTVTSMLLCSLIIIVAGVGDLYTDPQIHTVDGQGYGDANLGARGMALFFSSHKCNK